MQQFKAAGKWWKRSTQCKLLQHILMWLFYNIVHFTLQPYQVFVVVFYFYFYLPLMLIWCWHFTFMCLSIYSCLYLQQFSTTFILRHLLLLLIADGLERNIIVWFSSSHVCLITSIWHSMHLLHDCTVMFDTNDGSLLQISFQDLFIVYTTKLYLHQFISDHNYNSASAIVALKQSKYWLLYSPFLLGWLMYQF